MQPAQAFRNIGIISRPRRSNLAVVVPPLLHWLEARGINVVYDQETAGSLTGDVSGPYSRTSRGGVSTFAGAGWGWHAAGRRAGGGRERVFRFFLSIWGASVF